MGRPELRSRRPSVAGMAPPLCLARRNRPAAAVPRNPFLDRPRFVRGRAVDARRYRRGARFVRCRSIADRLTRRSRRSTDDFGRLPSNRQPGAWHAKHRCASRRQIAPQERAGEAPIYPFAKNMRQSRQIGRFLQGFYEAAFRERPTFEVNTGLTDRKPQLILAPPQDQPLRIKQLVTVLGRSEVVRSIALLQINEDEASLTRLRSELERSGVALAPLWSSTTGEGLLTSSVERVKGLEFDRLASCSVSRTSKAPH